MQSDTFFLIANIPKFLTDVALVAIHKEQPIRSNNTTQCVLVKILHRAMPISFFIQVLGIRNNLDSSGTCYTFVTIPGREMIPGCRIKKSGLGPNHIDTWFTVAPSRLPI
jgi:hypothetical protein